MNKNNSEDFYPCFIFNIQKQTNFFDYLINIYDLYTSTRIMYNDCFSVICTCFCNYFIFSRTKSSSSSLNGSMRRPCGSGVPVTGSGGRPHGLLENSLATGAVLRVVVHRDEKGYGMKVSGDKPVYVQSVKEGNCLVLLIYVEQDNCFESLHVKFLILYKNLQFTKINKYKQCYRNILGIRGFVNLSLRQNRAIPPGV